MWVGNILCYLAQMVMRDNQSKGTQSEGEENEPNETQGEPARTEFNLDNFENIEPEECYHSGHNSEESESEGDKADEFENEGVEGNNLILRKISEEEYNACDAPNNVFEKEENE